MCYVAIFKSRQYRLLKWNNLQLFCSTMVALFFFTTSLTSQHQIIQGIVLDEEEQPIFAANVFLRNAPESGQITDFDGGFQLAIEATQLEDTLVVSFLGYEEWQIAVQSIKKETKLNIQLQSNTTDLETVVVEASPSISQDFAVAQLKKLDIYLNPVSAADPLKAITVLPGSTNTDESANPSLRGSSFVRSRVVLNEVPVINPVRNSQINGLGNFSLFNAELIEYQNVYAGNPPIIYGNSSAGLVEIETRKEIQKNKYQATVSLANLGVFASQKLHKNSFVQAYANYQFPDAFLALNGESFQGLKEFGAKDYGINWHWNLKKAWSLNVFNYGLDERYRIEQELFQFRDEARSNRIRNFGIANLKYQAERYWISINQGLDWSKSSFILGNLASDKRETQSYSSINYKQFLSNSISLQTGLAYEQNTTDFENESPHYYFALSPEAPSSPDTINLKNRLAEGYLYFKWELQKGLTFGAGIRKNWPLAGQADYWSGQSSIRLNLGKKHSILLGGGHYHNYSTPSFFDPNYQLLSSSQLALEYFYTSGQWDVQLGSFLKREKGDVQLLPGEPNSRFRELIGAEMQVIWQPNEQFKFTLANTFLNVEVRNDQQSFRAQNDMDYFLKAVLLYNHPKLGSMALSMVHRPGLFYTPIIGGNWMADLDVFEPVYTTAINSAQLPNYTTVDLNYSKVIKLPRTSNIIVYATISNVLNRLNPRNPLFSEDYSRVISFEHYQRRAFYVGALITIYR